MYMVCTCPDEKGVVMVVSGGLSMTFKAETHDATNRCNTSPRQVAATNRLV